ncbi:MAG: hypothetical protein AAB935_01245 [Patescibacteria group bacterium]
MNIWREKILKIFSILSFGLLVFAILLIYFNLRRFSPPLILHFDEFRGVDFFGEKIEFFGIWFVGFAAVTINTALSEVFFHRERVLSYLFLGVNVLLSLLILIISAVVITVN